MNCVSLLLRYRPFFVVVVFMCSLISRATIIHFCCKILFLLSFFSKANYTDNNAMPNFGLIYLRLIILFHLI